MRSTQATNLIISMRSTQVMKLTNTLSTQAIHAVYAGNEINNKAVYARKEIEQLCGLRKQYMRSTQVKKLNNKYAVYANNKINYKHAVYASNVISMHNECKTMHMRHACQCK